MPAPIIERILTRPELLKNAYPSVSPQDIQKAEAQLGFPLPPLLREVYLYVGNGGFGPHLQSFFGLPGGYEDEGENLVTHHQKFGPGHDYYPWPDKLLTFFHWGCACRCCLDACEEDSPVIFYDPGYFEPMYAEGADPDVDEPAWEDPSPAFLVEADSLEAWLDAWLNGDAKMGYHGKRWIPKKEFRPQMMPDARQTGITFDIDDA